jgi:Family of unknown function (DUF5677)
VTLPEVPPIGIDWDELGRTDDRYPFDRLSWELLARVGQMCEQVMGGTGLGVDGERRPLSLDEAVAGGLFVRLTKLLRALFDATQSEQSEAHQILARCALETAINLRWLLWRNDPEEYKRFRADSFVTWLKWLEQTADETDTDPQADALAARLEVHIEAELTAAGLTRADVPKRTGSWGGGNFRARLADLDLSTCT